MQQLLLNQTVQPNGELPKALLNLILADKTHYGLQPTWAATWRERLFKNPPALMNVWGFEWSNDQEIAANLEWLNPNTQNGLCFLPFGQTGGGDAYCLMPLDNDPTTPLHTWGVALIYHDDEFSEFISASFSDFIYQELITGLADVSQYIDGISPEDAKRAALIDIESILESIQNEFTPEQLAVLQNIIKDLPAIREFAAKTAERRVYNTKGVYTIVSEDENIPTETYNSFDELEKHYSFLSSEEVEAALLLAPTPVLPKFAITYQWDI